MTSKDKASFCSITFVAVKTGRVLFFSHEKFFIFQKPDLVVLYRTKFYKGCFGLHQYRKVSSSTSSKEGLASSQMLFTAYLKGIQPEVRLIGKSLFDSTTRTMCSICCDQETFTCYGTQNFDYR